MSNIKMTETTLLLEDATNNPAGLAGLDGQGLGLGRNMGLGVNPSDAANVQNVINEVANRLIQSGGFTENNIITYDSSGAAQDSGIDISSALPFNAELVMTAFSLLANQQPTALSSGATDNFINIFFGAEQLLTNVNLTKFSGGDTEAGEFTINVGAAYLLIFISQYGRTSGAGTAKIHMQPTINGSPTPNAIIDEISTTIDADTKVVTILRNFSATETFSFQLRRLSVNGGTNDGGLFQFNPDVTGLPTSPSANISIFKLT